MPTEPSTNTTASASISDEAAVSPGEVARLRAALSDAERRAEIGRVVLSSSDDAVVTVDLSGVITGWNPAAERLYGHAAEAALGRTMDLVVPEDRRGEARALLAGVAKNETVERLETVRVHRSGAPIDVLVALSPLLAPSGAVTGAAEISRDVSGPRDAEARFWLAVEACPTAMVMSTFEGAIVRANTEAHRIFGYAAGELAGRPIEEILPAPAGERHPVRDGLAAETPRARAMGKGQTLVARRRDGTERIVEIGVNPIPAQTGALVLTVVVDVTDRVVAERALERHRGELERSNAELEQFAYVASHDLQEPLRMVASYTELLGERYAGKLDERADKYIRYAVDGAKRMQRLVSDLLAYSRVGSQGRPPAPVSTERVVRDVVDGMQTAIASAGATVALGPLPDVEADEGQLHQLFQNLIGNAIKFRSEAPPRIEVGAEPDGALVRFRVADNGIGIDPQYADRVFRMFQRLHPRGTYEGSGIGLAITKKIVERHGGRIWFESKPGAGTRFYFTLPATSKAPR